MLRNEIDQLLTNLLSSHPDITDINISVGRPFQVNSDNVLKPVDINPPVIQLTPFQTEIIALNLLQGNPKLLINLFRHGSCECSYQLRGKARLRINVFQQRGHFSVIIRQLSAQVPTIKQITLPKVFYKIPETRKGLILLSGGIGSGKSTTLAAILQHINMNKPEHIITLEDPIEFEFPPDKATFNQRELGSDFEDFPGEIQSALRLSPHTIVISEIKDRETMELAITASENYLVIGTIQSIGISQAVNKIVGMFKKEEEETIRGLLANIFQWIICQKLVPKIKGGRIPIFEILASTFKSQDTVAQGENEQRQFYEIMGKGTYGMQTFDQNLLALVKAEIISEAVAKNNCTRKTELSLGIDRIKIKKGMAPSELGELKMESE